MRPTSAITATEADAALRPLTSYPVVLLAVSGGPDSMALLHLAAEWYARRGARSPRLYAATIDHGLRPQSAQEAAMVATASAALGIAHTTLSWLGEKPATGVSVASRDARYALLTDHARQLANGQRAALVTGHHSDDQAETLLMRLARGSGVDGLAAMQPSRCLGGDEQIMLLRPLLAFSKARLVATIKARQVAVADDPTNRDTKFERPRLRTAMPLLREVGIDVESLALSARRLNDARAALDYAAAVFEQTLKLDLNHGVFADLDRPAFDLAPAYLRQRVVSRLIECLGGASPRPQLSEVECLVQRLEAEGDVISTLGGAVIAASGERIRVWREPGRLAAEEVALPAVDSVVWDERFRIARRSRSEWPLTIRPLGETGLRAIAAAVDVGGVPAQAAITQPALWQGLTLVAAPTLLPFVEPGVALGANPHAATAQPLCRQ